MDIAAIMEDEFGATFVCISLGRQVWELDNMKVARKVLETIDRAIPFNWCDIQQPRGPKLPRKPQIVIAKY